MGPYLPFLNNILPVGTPDPEPERQHRDAGFFGPLVRFWRHRRRRSAAHAEHGPRGEGEERAGFTPATFESEVRIARLSSHVSVARTHNVQRRGVVYAHASTQTDATNRFSISPARQRTENPGTPRETDECGGVAAQVKFQKPLKLKREITVHRARDYRPWCHPARLLERLSLLGRFGRQRRREATRQRRERKVVVRVGMLSTVADGSTERGIGRKRTFGEMVTREGIEEELWELAGEEREERRLSEETICGDGAEPLGLGAVMRMEEEGGG